jgi:hypothetical protein
MLFNFPSSYTNKCRIVDRAARTIRDMLETNANFLDKDLVEKAVEI